VTIQRMPVARAPEEA